MGQYHRVVNIDKKEYIDAHNMACGIKLLEFSESRVTTALCTLLAVSNGRGGGDLHTESPLAGSWGGDRIAIVGDYWEDEEADATGIPTWNFMDTDEGEDSYKDISRDILKVICQDQWIKQDFADSIARWDWGKDWSDILTAKDIAEAKERKEKEDQ